MTGFLQILVDAISLGSLYALATLGVGLVFGVLRLINFAYGDFITVGSYALILPAGAGAVAHVVIGRWPWPLLVAAVVAIVVIVAVISEFLVFRPLRTAKPAVLMIGSFALGFIIQNTIIVLYTGRPKAVGIWSSLGDAIEFGGVRIPELQMVTIGATLGLLAVLVLFLKRSSFGVQMRAASEDFRMARMLGVRANTVIGTAFVISGFLAAIVSLLFLAQVGVISYRMGTPLMLYAFIATVIGGMGSLTGAVIGGYIVGFAGIFLQALLPVELRTFRDAFVFAGVIVILIVRPQGLVMPRATQERV
jgi:branched-chain amino acid transport system permease protein